MKKDLEFENILLKKDLAISEHQRKYGLIGITDCFRREWSKIIIWHLDKEAKIAEKL